METVKAWTVTEWIEVLTAVGSTVVAVTTVFIAKIWPAYREWKAEKRVDEKYADDKVVKGYELVVADLRDRLTKQDTRLAHVEAELLKSSMECSRLHAENEALKRDVARLEAELRESHE